MCALLSILDRLIYNDSYNTNDDSVTDQNFDARKCRNFGDKIFVLGLVIYSVIHGNEDQVVVSLSI